MPPGFAGVEHAGISMDVAVVNYWANISKKDNELRPTLQHQLRFQYCENREVDRRRLGVLRAFFRYLTNRGTRLSNKGWFFCLSFMTPRELAGRTLYLTYHAPLGELRRIFAAGGPWEQRKTEKGRSEMEAAAKNLSPLPEAKSGARPIAIHLLSGKRFWYQTAFCLWTLARHTQQTILPTIYDDGSLQAEHRVYLTTLFPEINFVNRGEIEERLDNLLPITRYPVLRDRWIHYPNIRKLIDVHLGKPGWKLVLDSDLLFFRRPTFLVEWLQYPEKPLHAVDCMTSYGYDRALINHLAGTPVAERINVGLAGLNGSDMDWDQLEYWSRELISKQGTNYYLEQALIAMLVAGQACSVAPAADYITYPDSLEAHACGAVMHHYVADSKRWYFQHCWRRALH